MGLRFSKTIRMGKFLRVNLSKSGPSIGLGPRGLNINLSRRGARGTVGMPGTGISYTTQENWRDLAHAENEKHAEGAGGPPNRSSSFTAGITFIIVVSVLLIAVALLTR